MPVINGLLAALAIFFAISTSPTDEKFLEALRSHDISYESPEWAIWDGHQTCLALDNGYSPTQVAEALMQQTRLDAYHAGFFVGASIGAYCPQWVG